MRPLVFVLMCLACFSTHSQEAVRLQRVPVEMPPGEGELEGMALVETESGSVLVTEMRVQGVRAFYMFVWTGDRLQSQAIGPRTIPAQFEPPPTHQSTSRTIAGRSGRYWQVAGSELQRDPNQRYWVSAPRLSELTYAEIDAGGYQLSPDLDSPLALGVTVERPSGSAQRLCVLEPNILAVEDRLTTLGASWIRPVDERFLVVPVGTSSSGGAGRAAIWLYDEDFGLQSATDFDVAYDPNRLPVVRQVDLTGDGIEELVVASTASGASPFVVYQLDRSAAGPRLLSFRLCGSRIQGEDVARLQRALEGAGYSVGPHGADGWYGPDTRAAVIRYQREIGVVPTGIFDMAEPLP
ncbi:MAG: peptidoglycan-binding domain-containing protein [Spirochaetales bacterium]